VVVSLDNRSKWHVPLQTTGMILTSVGIFMGHHHKGREFPYTVCSGSDNCEPRQLKIDVMSSGTWDHGQDHHFSAYSGKPCVPPPRVYRGKARISTFMRYSKRLQGSISNSIYMKTRTARSLSAFMDTWARRSRSLDGPRYCWV
jgi:hypothetical protein